MSTQDAFEKWADLKGYSIRKLFDNTTYADDRTARAKESWQASQAHNDTVIEEMAKQAEINEALYRDDITELKENLRIVKSAADAEALEVDSRGKLIAELVEALEDAEESLSRFTSDEGSTQKDFDTCDRVHSVIAKHKGQS